MPTYHLDILVDGKDRGGSSLLRGIGGLVAGLGKAALIAATGGVLALSGAFGTAITKANAFGETMSGVKAVLSPTAGEFSGLSAKALQLGKDTSFGASEAAAGIEMLAKNGLNATQIINGAADATLALAAATGLKGNEGLASAADIATNAMSIFNIRAEEMSRAINGITGVTVASQFDINDYKLALAQAGGTAKTAGVEFNDFNTAIAAISPLFASGSDAGTSFKTMLQRLVPVSGPAAEAMARLGILAEDGSNKFFDASGSLKSMAEVAGVLQEAMRGLSEEDAIDLFTTAFGTDAQRAAFALAQTGSAEFRRLAESIAQVDAAAQAATRLDNLRGDVEQLKGSLETASIELGTAFTPLLRQLTQAATAFVNSNLIGRDWSPLVNGVTSAATAIGGFLGQVQAAGGPVAFLRGQVTELAIATGAWAIGLGNQATTAVQAWATGLIEGAHSALPGWIDSLEGWAIAAGAWAIDAIPGLILHLLELRNQAVGWALGQVPNLIEAVRPWSLAFLQWVVDAAPGMLSEFGRLTGGLLDTIGASLPSIVGALAGWGAELVNWVIVAGPKLLPELLTLAGGLAGWIAERVPIIAGQLGEWGIQFVSWVGATTPKLITAAGEMLGTLLLWLYDNRGTIFTTLATWSLEFSRWVREDASPAFGQALLDLGSGVWATIKDKWNGAFQPGTIGQAIVDGLKQGVADAWGDLVADLQQRLTNLATLGLSITPAGGALQNAGAIPSFASGVTNFGGGLAYVHAGELLVNMSRGSSVMPASATRGLFAGGGGGGGGGGGFTWTGDLVIQEAGNARETARQVREELVKLGKRNGGNVLGGFA